MKTECKMVTKMIQTLIQKETKRNLNLSFTQFSETRLPQAQSGLLPQAIEIRSGPKAPGRDRVGERVELFCLFLFLLVGPLLSEVFSFNGSPARAFASFFGLRRRTFFRRFFEVFSRRFFIGFKSLLDTICGSIFQ